MSACPHTTLPVLKKAVPLLLVLLLALASCGGSDGALFMPDIYGNGMVLQRDVPLTVQGKAVPGESVRVMLAGQRRSAVCDSEGCWNVTFAPLSAGGPWTMTVASHGSRLCFEDVMIGEVWLCSGQSNMEFTLPFSPAYRQALDRLQGDTLQLLQPRTDPSCPLRIYNQRACYPTDNCRWSHEALAAIRRHDYLSPAVWEGCTPSSVGDLSAVAYYFGCMLQDSLQVPVGLIVNAVGGTPAESWIDRATLADSLPAILDDWLHNPLMQAWCRQRAACNLGIDPNSPDISLQHHPYEPCYMYDAGIAPLARYPLRGVIWYQGESNAHDIATHARLFPLLVDSWRRTWANPDMPFLYVQLSSLNRPTWPSFRDSQRRLLDEVPHTGMAVCSDVGDSLDVHPIFKQPVGERLARRALADVYGQPWFAVHPSAAGGPLFTSVSFEGSTAVVTFRCAEGLCTSDGAPLRTFEVADASGVFHPAVASIEGDRVVVSSPAVAQPTRVRYGWQPFTRANLTNAFGLPASTFDSAPTLQVDSCSTHFQ